jgi:hypothetical protein
MEARMTVGDTSRDATAAMIAADGGRGEGAQRRI